MRRRDRRRVLGGAAALLAMTALARAAPLRVVPLQFRLAGGGVAPVLAEVADTPRARRLGLMFRQSLPRGRGLLLWWPTPRMAVIWMKNMRFALDLVFIDTDGRVVRIFRHVPPVVGPLYSAGRPVRAVLELAAGEAQRLGLHEGAQVNLEMLSSGRRR